MKKLGIFKDHIDGSIKCVYEKDKNIIEMTILYNRPTRDVVCVPIHHFCNLGCKMCHLTNNSLNKRMIPIEIDNFIDALFETLKIKNTNKKNLLISFMGVGEPLLNLKLISDLYLKEDSIKEKFGYENISYAISTMMPNDNMKELINFVKQSKIPLKVHFSLHSPLDNKRKNLIPHTKVNIDEALNYLIDYKEVVQNDNDILKEYMKMHSNDIPIEIHYTLIKGVNDTEDELNELIRLSNKFRIPIKFIRFNELNDLNKSDKETKWKNTLKSNIPDLIVKTYSPPGREIGSSCGEFTKHYYHEEIETEEEKEEFLKWKEKHEISME